MPGRDEKPPKDGAKDVDPGKNVADIRRERTYRFEKSEVDPDRFYVRSRDDSGHSEWARVRMQPRTYDQIMQYVGKKSPFGWRTVSDAFRDAMVHRLAYLSSRFGDDDQRTSFQVFLADLQFAEDMAIEREARQWVQSVTDEVDAIVDDYTRRDQPDIALEKLQRYLEQIPGREEAHHVYIHGYIKQKIAELRDVIRKNKA